MTPPNSHFIDHKRHAIQSFHQFCQGQGFPKTPLEVFFEVSNVCDLKCAMCNTFSGLAPHRQANLQSTKRGFLDMAALTENFDPILPGALLVHCFGYGEPTLHPEFRRMIQYLSQYEVMIDFTTNGMGLDQDTAGFLVESGVYKVIVSFSGSTAEIYENLYLGGKFETVLAGLRRLADHKRRRNSPYPLIEINSLAVRPHVASFDQFVELMARHGADLIHLKSLENTPEIPYLYEHTSIMRPWVEGKIIARAEKLGRKLGVRISADQYLRHGVADQAEYERRLAALQATAERHLPDGRYGQSPIGDFARLAANLKPAPLRPHRPPPPRCLTQTEHGALVQALLETAPHPSDPPFHCMEPFKTLYVSRNGSVKPCCFANPHDWQLGDIAHTAPLDIWRGIGFTTVRQGILKQHYPKQLCGHCLDVQAAPPAHGVAGLTLDYLDWHRHRFGDTGGRAALSSTINDLSAATSGRIVSRQQGNPAAPVPPLSDQPELPASPLLDHTVKTVIQGNLDTLGSAVSGWVWLPLQPNVRLPITVWHGDRILAQGLAELPRRDLALAGKGDGAYGFSLLVPLPEDQVRNDVFVTVGDDPQRLRFIPAALQETAAPAPSQPAAIRVCVDAVSVGESCNMIGWALHSGQALQTLTLTVDGIPQGRGRHLLPRTDVAGLYPGNPHAAAAGFRWDGIQSAGQIALHAQLADGRQAVVPIGQRQPDGTFTLDEQHWNCRLLPLNVPPHLDFSHLTAILRVVSPTPPPPPVLAAPALVIVPVYGGLAHLPAFFQSLLDHTAQPHRLIIVDDGNRDPAVLDLLAALPLPPHATVIRRPRNGGYVEALHTAFAQWQDQHVVVLNTDTILPPHWLPRLLRPLEQDAAIASATPFSNGGSICGFPHMPQDNSPYLGLDVTTIDAALARIDAAAIRPHLPTGVGFCMALSRHALARIGFMERETFQAGYGEENDWCCKATQAGFTHVLVPDLYVHHAHGGSFPSQQKRKLMARNLAIVNQRYPQYAARVLSTVLSDPLGNLRQFMAFLLAAQTHPGHALLCEAPAPWDDRPTIAVQFRPESLSWTYDFHWPQGRLHVTGGNWGEVTALRACVPIGEDRLPASLSHRPSHKTFPQ